jgi:hypothetical protein
MPGKKKNYYKKYFSGQPLGKTRLFAVGISERAGYHIA